MTESFPLKLHVIKRPSPGFWAIMENRRVKAANIPEVFPVPDAIGLMQGPAAAILAAADLAEKAAAVQVAEIKGVCPSHITVIAVYGDTSAVLAALSAVREALQETFFHG
jgi:ethanolamine utilization microcompartment shell protein EutS